MKELIVISGPTASGKSGAAAELSLKIKGEIISADSMQVYRSMDIGTAKLKKDEMKGVPHHMIDILEPEEEFNVAVFKARADRCIEEIRGRGHIPVITGGTGFYTQAVIYGIDFKENETDPVLRAELEKKAGEKGTRYIEEELEKVDEISAHKYRGNLKRMIRALEYYLLTNDRMSDKNERERSRAPVYDTAHFCFILPRDLLYKRIDERVDRMMDEGLLDEVRALYDKGLERSLNSMQGLGYKQLFLYFDGKKTLEEAVEDIKKETRHFAKRQLTWYRNQRDIIYIDREKYKDDEEAAGEMLRFLE